MMEAFSSGNPLRGSKQASNPAVPCISTHQPDTVNHTRLQEQSTCRIDGALVLAVHAGSRTIRSHVLVRGAWCFSWADGRSGTTSTWLVVCHLAPADGASLPVNRTPIWKSLNTGTASWNRSLQQPHRARKPLIMAPFAGSGRHGSRRRALRFKILSLGDECVGKSCLIKR